MEKELQVISSIMKWLEDCPPSLEELRQRNITEAKQVVYSTLGHNAPSKGCFELADRYWMCGNVKKGKILSEKPPECSEHFAYYLDDNGKLLCAVETEKQDGRFVTSEDHYLIDWNQHTVVYGSSYLQRPIDEYTVYMTDDMQRVYAKADMGACIKNVDLIYFYYDEHNQVNKSYEYSFMLLEKKDKLPAHQIKMINGIPYKYFYSEIWY